MLHHIQNRLLQTHIVYGPNHPILDITTILSSAINAFGSPPGFSALVMHAVDDVLRVAWLGCCGFVLIRDDAIFFRSYGAPPGAPAMERLIHSNCPSSGTISPRIPSNVVDTPVSIAATHRSDTPFTIDTTSIQTDFIQLQDNDLIIAATDGFFSNVTEDQIVAFVRPVPDSYDATLAIANNTCLGSWRYDDVEFIAYYLAIIAANFATVRTMQSYLPFPFPPGPRLDDITVMCVSASYVD